MQNFMSLTLEQFNKIVLKEDLKVFGEDLEERITKKINDRIDLLINAVDGIVKNYENHQTEHVSNIGTHDRFEVRIAKLEESVTR
jgi:hypothetical protein